MLPALVVNENVPAGTVAALRTSGFDVLAIGEAHPATSDRAVIAIARDTGRWLVTFDRDYGELIFKRGEAAPVAILFLRQRPRRPSDFAELIRAAVAADEQQARLRGHLAVLDGRSIRLRRLPQVPHGR
jgi:predicted nuclease of predicted toxin-antitoxin system